MGFDIGKAFGAAKTPIMVVVGLAVVNFVLTFLGIGLLGLVLSPIGLLVYLWAGYNATKALKMDLVNAGLVGLVTAVVGGIVGILLTIILFAIQGNLLGVVVMLIAGIIGIVIGAIMGFIIAAIGGFIGQKF